MGLACQEVQDPVAQGGVWALSLVMGLDGTMVLKAELHSYMVFLLSRWVRALCSAMAVALYVDLLGQYANCSGSRVSGKIELLNCDSTLSLY